ncbi:MULTISPECIES: carboxypeptidase-like regulatory domain-containing protein [Acidobacteriaceae]|uniref:carboxypeptidase-like regulatory domain-containing protein n=1 Tax=Acidobacteriaceae TaxID=204434 RepID=UPI00131DDE23|nr:MULTISPECIES: carboxypeptidase-like regulatory domain-containing protein [Acidobacteriaceae]MDW5266440.1 carboxypeptidase-like regulatory domain-containing protein [Edaphobacter sp.]
MKIALLALMLSTASVCLAVGPGATVSGVVRDADGVAQMGALVQVLATDSALVGTAFTDLHGRYLIASLLPGKYEVRATAALFVPTTRGDLHLRPGAQAVVNLTLNTIFNTTTWLPAERRRADEPGDDWKWTLRSAVNRPILRMAGDDGNVMTVSSSVTEESSKPSSRVRAAVSSGDGGFANGGIHNVVTVDRVLDDGSGMVLRGDIGTGLGPWMGSPSMNLSSGFERKQGFAGSSRLVASYQSHPEILGSGNTPGLQTLQLASAEKMQIGDFADVEVGGVLYAIHAAGYLVASRPFLKVTTHPSETWTVGYRMATARDLQSYAGLNTVQQEMPVAVTSQGRMRTESGLHQEFAVGRKLGPGLVQLAYYLDSLNQVTVEGGGSLSPSDIAQADESPIGGVLADQTTGSFRLLNAGYKTNGMNLTLSEPLTTNMWVALEYSTGAALTAKDEDVLTMEDMPTALKPMTSQTATLAVKGKVLRSGTSVRAAYRWQPARMVTAVNPYAAFSDQAYLSCYLRQAIKLGNLLPPGLEATVDVTNLLAQGYRPFVSADGKTLFLAQSPRALQAGLAFTF